MNNKLHIEIPVLDHGFIRVIDYMGNDAAVVQAARVSYGRGTRQRNEDAALIAYLMRHWHSTPFEMCEIKFHIKLPIFVARQWIRHRTANVNEYSTRYSLAIEATQSTLPGEWRTQAASNRQGSGDPLPLELGEQLTKSEQEFQSAARKLYEDRINAGVAREQARKDLPLCTYTEAYWKVDLHNLLHFLELRMDTHAQYEIRMFAKTIAEQIVAPLFPLAWEAFQDYKVGAMFLTRLDRAVIARLMQRLRDQNRATATEEDFLAVQDDNWREMSRNRERDECRQKLVELGML